MLGFIGNLWQAMWAGVDRFYEQYLRPRDPKIELENQLRIMYARGEIDRESFFHLRFRLYKNAIGRGEITLLHRAAMQRMEGPASLPPGGSSPQNQPQLDHLYLDQVLLEEARYELEERRKALGQEIQWLKEQTESARQSAQDSLPDEELARAYLEIWQDLMELSRSLEERSLLASQSLKRMQALEVELRAAVTQIKLLQAQERMAELHLRVRRDLLPR